MEDTYLMESDVELKLGPEAAKDHQRRLAEGFYERFLSGTNILDVGYRGGGADTQPITENAIGIDLDFPGYDGRILPFPDESQDAVFASHCLEHIDNYGEALAEWNRVLKVGGFLIVAVPHRDLYERKRSLPSRFNADHRRLYTPARLLSEVESSLPVGCHRVRHLRDIDTGFDYSTPPEVHAMGSYEIELVVEKISPPAYRGELLASRELEEYIDFFTKQIVKLIEAKRANNSERYERVLSVTKDLPIPPLHAIRSALNQSSGRMYGEELDSELRQAVLTVAAVCPFDADYYRSRYKDLSKLPDIALREHFATYGFLEGRKATAARGLF